MQGAGVFNITKEGNYISTGGFNVLADGINGMPSTATKQFCALDHKQYFSSKNLRSLGNLTQR